MKINQLLSLMIIFASLFTPVLGFGECTSGDCKNGTGTFSFKDGGFYSGEWQDGLMNGTGNYVFPDGRRYKGEFLDGLFEGEGTLYSKDGKQTTGRFSNNNFVGKGNEVGLTFQSAEDCIQNGACQIGQNDRGTYIKIPSNVMVIQSTKPDDYGENIVFDRRKTNNWSTVVLPHGNFQTTHNGTIANELYELGQFIGKSTSKSQPARTGKTVQQAEPWQSVSKQNKPDDDWFRKKREEEQRQDDWQKSSEQNKSDRKRDGLNSCNDGCDKSYYRCINNKYTQDCEDNKSRCKKNCWTSYR